ncbi:MAG TPA: response regulator [Lachnospiraceae bacterium]|nr:response regulator [Lachnospiraceae bacterium]
MVSILVIDDSVFSQRVTADLIKKMLPEAEFHFANDGEQGLEAYKELNPDFVFLDLLMPKLNGLDVVRLLRKYDAGANIFVISADVQKSVKDKAVELGVMEFINKPFTAEKAELTAKIIRERINEAG